MLNLNIKQQEACQHIEGPLLVLAAPGSGKTKVICHRIRYLTKKGIPSEKICVITFTRNAARHLRQQLLSFPEVSKGEELPGFMGTIHGLCYFILKQTRHYRPQILSEKEKHAVIKALLHNLYPNMLIDEEVVDSVFSSDIGEKIGETYRQEKRRLGVLDYDDLIVETINLLLQKQDVLHHWQKIYSYYMVDEFQDVSKKQLELLTLLGGKSANIMAVGDDDQAIYGFRGSMPGIFKEFEEGFLQCKKVILHTNYRSKDEILHLAKGLIRHNEVRCPKDMKGVRGRGGQVLLGRFQNEKEEQIAILARMKEILLTLPEGEKIGVLFRKNYQLEAFQKVAQESGLFITDFEREKQDVIGQLKAYIDVMIELEAKKELQLELILPILQCYPEKISRCYIPPGKFSLDSWKNFTKACDKQEHERVCRLERDITMIKEYGPYLGLKYLFYSLGYQQYACEKWGKRVSGEILNSILVIAKDAENWKRLKEIIGVNTEKNEGDSPVQFMTIHGAKGLEFHTVFLPDLKDEVIPGKDKTEVEEIEEERRVLYVAMTRAKVNLYLSYSGDKFSRFIKETLP